MSEYIGSFCFDFFGGTGTSDGAVGDAGLGKGGDGAGQMSSSTLSSITVGAETGGGFLPARARGLA